MNPIVRKGIDVGVTVAKKGISIAGPVFVTSVANGTAKNVINKIRYGGKVKYDDAAKVILDSDMLSSYKKEALLLLKDDAEPKYYRTVIYVVQSSLLASDRIDMIKTLNEKSQNQNGEA